MTQVDWSFRDIVNEARMLIVALLVRAAAHIAPNTPDGLHFMSFAAGWARSEMTQTEEVE